MTSSTITERKVVHLGNTRNVTRSCHRIVTSVSVVQHESTTYDVADRRKVSSSSIAVCKHGQYRAIRQDDTISVSTSVAFRVADVTTDRGARSDRELLAVGVVDREYRIFESGFRLSKNTVGYRQGTLSNGAVNGEGSVVVDRIDHICFVTSGVHKCVSSKRPYDHRSGRHGNTRGRSRNTEPKITRYSGGTSSVCNVLVCSVEARERQRSTIVIHGCAGDTGSAPVKRGCSIHIDTTSDRSRTQDRESPCGIDIDICSSTACCGEVLGERDVPCCRFHNVVDSYRVGDRQESARVVDGQRPEGTQARRELISGGSATREDPRVGYIQVTCTCNSRGRTRESTVRAPH